MLSSQPGVHPSSSIFRFLLKSRSMTWVSVRSRDCRITTLELLLQATCSWRKHLCVCPQRMVLIKSRLKSSWSMWSPAFWKSVRAGWSSSVWPALNTNLRGKAAINKVFWFKHKMILTNYSRLSTVKAQSSSSDIVTVTTTPSSHHDFLKTLCAMWKKDLKFTAEDMKSNGNLFLGRQI